MYYDQSEFDIRCEWGARGIEALSPISDVVVIVDVLSFSTSVDIAASRGAAVLPYRWKDDSAVEFAQQQHAILAGGRHQGGVYTLSPASLQQILAGTRLVLPSPNGSTLTMLAGGTPVLAGCLRNCEAVARCAQSIGRRIAVIPAGERWSDGSLRPAIDDWIGAGAIVAHLSGTRSPEAALAAAAFASAKDALGPLLHGCASGRELIETGFSQDVEIAAKFNVSACMPILRDGAYIAGP